MKKAFSLSLVLFLLSSFALLAQTEANYECNFEDPIQNAQWVLNPGYFGQQSPNKWYIGSATQNGGKNSLYISNTEGQTTTYAASAYCMMAYTQLTLEEGNYQLGFDWKAMGTDKEEDQLMVLWVPMQIQIAGGTPEDIVINCAAQNAVPTDLASYALELTFDDRKYLNNTVAWQTCEAQIDADGEPHRLVFLWHNGTKEPLPPSACIDNIIIVNELACAKPEKLGVAVQNGEVKVWWDGSEDVDQYEVKYYSHYTNEWGTALTNTNSVVIGDIHEGYVDFYVRSMCGGNVKSISTSVSQFIYYPSERCFDYLTLTDENCFIVNEFASTTGNVTYEPKKVDEGYGYVESRHTVHWLQDEYDPRTGGLLKTVPEGEIASVRLGNWNTGHESERIEYKFTVDTNSAPVLIMKYAVVLENPGHGPTEDPRFTLRVLNKGKQITKCAQADFTSNAREVLDGWNIYYPNGPTGIPIVWKDWTTIGVNLSDYQGEELTIQLNTFDCSLGGHYGYAYFTLACSDGKMTGINCGDTPTDYFQAPDGFKYRWYRQDNPFNIISRDQKFEVDSRDTLTYGCELMYPEDTTCYFTLFASAVPRYPIAATEYSYKPSNCQNIVEFNNLSHVMTVNQITKDSVHRLAEKCDRVVWQFGDGAQSSEYNPSHIYPSSGGTFHVKLTAAISSCEESIEFDITLPELNITIDTLHYVTCEGNAYSFNGKTYWQTGIYQDTLKSIAGCDSIIVIDFEVIDKFIVDIDTTILSDQTYFFNGQEISKGGVYKANLKNINGCDSIVTLNLKVHGLLNVELDSLYQTCAGENDLTVDFSIVQGIADAFSISFNSNEVFSDIPKTEDVPLGQIILPLPKDVKPALHSAQVIFYDSLGRDFIQTIALRINYPDSILTQRWGDVIAVKNSNFNGGYDFTAYQWYYNNQQLDGETNSYIYLPEGLDTNGAYHVLLTRSDGVVLPSCPIVPTPYSQNKNIPTLIEHNEQFTVQGATKASWYTPYGLKYTEKTLTSGDQRLAAPANSGVYILYLCLEDGSIHVQRIVVL